MMEAKRKHTEYTEIATNILAVHDRNPRNPSGVEELAASIKSVGVIQPLVVTPNGAGYMVIAGSRRLAAARVANLETVPCVIRGLDSDDEASAISISENLHRRNIDPLQEAEAIRFMVSEDGLTREDVAAALGISVSTVDRRLQLAQLDKSVRDLYHNEDSPIAHFSTRMLELVAAQQPETQQDLAEVWNRREHWSRPPATLDELIQVVDRNSMKLGGVGWDLEEEELGGMRACKGCPHNTASRPTLFDDLNYESARCSNEDCFNTKYLAHLKRRYDEAKQRHGKQLVVVASSGYRGLDVEAIGASPLSTWEWKESQAKNSAPAFDISNPDHTDLLVKPNKSSSSASPTVAAAKMDPKAQLERSEAMLRRKRLRHAVPELIEMLEVSEPPGWQNLLRLVAEIGGPYRRTDRYGGQIDLKELDEAKESLWRDTVDVLRQRLNTRNSFDDFDSLESDAAFLADLIGRDWNCLWTDACEACPPSKALIRRREEAS